MFFVFFAIAPSLAEGVLVEGLPAGSHSETLSEEEPEMPTLEQNLSQEIIADPQQALPQSPEGQGSSGGMITGSAETVLDTETATIEIAEDKISPKRIMLLPGTTVVWRNVGESTVQVSFIGKAISTTCKAPRGFSIAGTGVYRSLPIAPGDIVSLCFLEPDLYVFEVQAPISKNTESESEKTALNKIVGAVQIVKQN